MFNTPNWFLMPLDYLQMHQYDEAIPNFTTIQNYLIFPLINHPITLPHLNPRLELHHLLNHPRLIIPPHIHFVLILHPQFPNLLKSLLKHLSTHQHLTVLLIFQLHFYLSPSHHYPTILIIPKNLVNSYHLKFTHSKI